MKRFIALVIVSLASPNLLMADTSDAQLVLTATSHQSKNRLESYRPAASSLGHIKKTTKSDESKRIQGKSNLGKVTLTRRTETQNRHGTNHERKAAIAQRKIRPENPQKSKGLAGFTFYSADAFLDTDLDGDGYYSDFTVNFDADNDFGFANVYAVIYLSENGGPWTEFFVTDVFSINFDDASDEYSLSSTLNFGYPSDQYDVLVDLYEDGFDGIVASISSDDVDSLYALPLEDLEHEVTVNTSQISFVATTVAGDLDGDGYYTKLTLEYDIEAQYSGDNVYAEIVVTSQTEGWQQVLSSDSFTLGNQTEFVDLTFNTGYSAGYYDVQINLINEVTGEVITDAGQEFSSLNSLPLESVNNDDIFDDPFASDVDVVVYGGGSLGWGALTIGLLFVRLRKNALKLTAAS